MGKYFMYIQYSFNVQPNLSNENRKVQVAFAKKIQEEGALQTIHITKVCYEECL